MISQSELKDILDYDPDTGLFRWTYNASTRARTGSIAGTVDSDGYTVIRICGRGYKAHRLAWLYVYGTWPTLQIDHIDEGKRNNALANLREATPSENLQNISHGNTGSASGLRGVSWFSQYGKWKACFQLAGRKFFVGHFDDKHAAYAAVLDAKRVALEAI